MAVVWKRIRVTEEKKIVFNLRILTFFSKIHFFLIIFLLFLTILV